MRRIILLTVGLLIVLTAIAIGVMRLGGLAPTERVVAPARSQAPQADTQVLADNLEIPWEVAVAPDGRLFVTERPGRVRVIDQTGKLQEKPLLTLEVPKQGEGGLQGLALDPDFATNKFVYLYASYLNGEELLNRVSRYREENGSLVAPQTLVEGIPGNNNHNGGRLAFGPDKKLYVTTGDSQEPSLAQDRNSLAGKILRLNPDGSVPADNPFGNAIWSYGHRNPQGLAWDTKNDLYLTEHGPSGDLGLCCRDEVNKIDRGGNYGWPTISGDQKRDGLVSPLLSSGNTNTWAPGGAAFGSNGKLYFAALRGTHLHEVTIENGQRTADRELLKDTYGRLRVVTAGPDGTLYLATSNRDGRGEVNPGDDKIIRIKLPQ